MLRRGARGAPEADDAALASRSAALSCRGSGFPLRRLLAKADQCLGDERFKLDHADGVLDFHKSRDGGGALGFRIQQRNHGALYGQLVDLLHRRHESPLGNQQDIDRTGGAGSDGLRRVVADPDHDQLSAIPLDLAHQMLVAPEHHYRNAHCCPPAGL